MQDEDLFRMWNAIEVPEFSKAELLEMTKARNQPKLRRVQRHLLMQVTAFSALIAMYYLFFGNGSHGFYVGLLLIAGLGMFILHESLVYRFFNQPQKGISIPDTRREYGKSLKRMTIVTVILRGLATCLLIFFLSLAISVDSVKFWVLRGSGLVLAGQFWMVLRVWLKRLKEVGDVILSYHPLNFLLGDDDGPSQGLDKFSRR